MTLKSSGTSKLLSNAGKRTRAAADSYTGILKKTPQWRWNHANMDARRAHAILGHALRKGTITRGRCVECGSLRTDGHHPDYSEPLTVIWLCRRHHRALHVAERKAAA